MNRKPQKIDRVSMAYRLKWARFCVGYSIMVLISLVFSGFSLGAFADRLYPHTKYDGERAHYHHSVITQSIRQVGTVFYNESWRYFTKVIEEAKLKASANPNVGNFSVRFFEGSELDDKATAKFHRENSIKTIEVTITPSNPSKRAKRALALSAHYDGHNVGQSAYDNAINVAMLLELITSVAEADAELPVTLVVILLGSEEFGLSGSRHYIHNAWTLSAHILNLDAIGDGLPFGLVQRTKKASAVMKTMRKVPGMLCLTFGTTFMDSGMVSSFTDKAVFEYWGYTGGEIDFIGNPGHYHTKLDKIRSSRDITILGNQVFYFVMNFDDDEQELNYGVIGISPFSIAIFLVPLKAMCVVMLVPVAVVFAATRWSVSREAWKRVGAMILNFFCNGGTLIGMCGLLSVVNSMSYVDHMCLGFALLLVIGGSTFYFYTAVLWANNIHPLAWQVWFTFITAILGASLCFSELGLGGLFATCVSYVPYILFWRKAKRYGMWFVIFNFIAVIPFLFEFVNVWTFIVKYSGTMGGALPDVFSGALIFLISYVCGIAVLPFSYRYEEAREAEERAEPVWRFSRIFAAVVAAVGFVALCIKSRPFSADYPIKGNLQQIYYENGSSVIAFRPLLSRFIRELKGSIAYYPEMHIESEYRAPYMSSPAIVQRLGKVHMPSYFAFPDFEFVELSRQKNKRNVQFNLTHVPNGMKAVVLWIKCPNNVDCVESIDGVLKPVHGPIDTASHGIALRHQPVYQGTVINMTVYSDDPIPVDVLSNYNERSEECREFFSVFPNYVLPMQKMNALENTVLLQARTI